MRKQIVPSVLVLKQTGCNPFQKRLPRHYAPTKQHALRPSPTHKPVAMYLMPPVMPEPYARCNCWTP